MKDAIVLDLGDLSLQAKKLREQAETQAAQIIAEAQATAQKLIEGAEERGFEQGRRKGYEQGMAEGQQQGHVEALQSMADQFQQLQQSLIEVAAEWAGRRTRIERDARQDVLRFALLLGERLVHRVIETDPQVVVDQLTAALAHIMRPLDVTVRISPEDRTLLEEALPQLQTEFSHLHGIHLVDDPAISRGGCILSFGQGRIDATIEKQIDRVVETLLPGESVQASAPAPVGVYSETGAAGNGDSEGNGEGNGHAEQVGFDGSIDADGPGTKNNGNGDGEASGPADLPEN